MSAYAASCDYTKTIQHFEEVAKETIPGYKMVVMGNPEATNLMDNLAKLKGPPPTRDIDHIAIITIEGSNNVLINFIKDDCVMFSAVVPEPLFRRLLTNI